MSWSPRAAGLLLMLVVCTGCSWVDVRFNSDEGGRGLSPTFAPTAPAISIGGSRGVNDPEGPDDDDTPAK